MKTEKSNYKSFEVKDVRSEGLSDRIARLDVFAIAKVADDVEKTDKALFDLDALVYQKGDSYIKDSTKVDKIFDELRIQVFKLLNFIKNITGETVSPSELEEELYNITSEDIDNMNEERVKYKED